MKQKDTLGQFEALVLTAVVACGDNAYSMVIHEKTIELARRQIRLAAVYITLERMMDKKYLKSWLGDPTPERGGKAKRFYRLTAAGQNVLEEATTTGKTLYDTYWESMKWKLARKTR